MQPTTGAQQRPLGALCVYPIGSSGWAISFKANCEVVRKPSKASLRENKYHKQSNNHLSLFHSNVLMAKNVPIKSQTTRFRKILLSSHDSAASCAANESGRNTNRIPWVNHFRGNIAAKRCIHSGSCVKTKKTPLKNCKIITTGDTISDALRPFLGIAEKAIPKTVVVAVPRGTSQRKVSQRVLWVGSANSKTSLPHPISSISCKVME